MAYLHATVSYSEGNIPMIKCIITLKQGPEMCTAFLLKRYIMSSIYFGTNGISSIEVV